MKICLYIIFSFLLISSSLYADPWNKWVTTFDLFEGFDVDDWSITGGTSPVKTLDEVHYTQGTGSMNIANDGGTSYFYKSSITYDFTNYSAISIDVYEGSYQADQGILVRFQTSAGNYYTYTFNFGNSVKLATHWHRFIFAKSLFVATGSPDWSNITEACIATYAGGSGASQITVDNLRGYTGQAVCIWQFDDGYQSTLDLIEPVLRANGQKGTIMVNYKGIVAGGATYLDLSELITINSYGWDLCNHGKNHFDLSAIGDADSLSDEINFTRDYLIANGLRRGADYYTYAGGGGEITQAVMDSITHKHKTNIVAYNIAHQAHPNGIGTGYDWYEIRGYYPVWANDGNTAYVKSLIDDRISEGGLLVIGSHDLTAAMTDSLEIVSDYLKTKVDSGDIKVLTWSKYYNDGWMLNTNNTTPFYSMNGTVRTSILKVNKVSK